MKKFIHHDENWPNHYWDDEKLQPLLSRINEKISKWLNEKLRIEDNRISQGFDNNVYLKLLFDNAIITSEMEGAHIDKKHLYESFKKNFYRSIKKTMQISQEGPKIGNIGRNEFDLAKMMLDSHLNCWSELDKERLCKWHRWLFPDRIDEHGQEIITGSWRTDEMTVGLYYTAPEADRMSSEMSKFLTWLNDDFHTDALVKAGRAHLWFEQIHPFDNGNGRAGRAIMDLMLNRAVDFPKQTVIFEIFHSMTHQIGHHERRQYYEGLAQHNFIENNKDAFDITDWLTWFLECLERSMEHTNEITRRHDRNMQVGYYITGNENFKLNVRQKRAIRRMLDFQWEGVEMTTGKYMEINDIEDSKRLTANRDITKLVEMGVFFVVDPNASKMKTSYRLITWEEIKKKSEKEKHRIREALTKGTWSGLPAGKQEKTGKSPAVFLFDED